MKKWAFVLVLLMLFLCTIFGVYLFMNRQNTSCFRVDDKGTIEATVTKWNYKTNTVSIKQGLLCSTSVKIAPLKPLVAIPINKSNEPKNEQIVFPSSGIDWETAFCPGDTVQLRYKDTTAKGLPTVPNDIRNMGPRKCGGI